MENKFSIARSLGCLTGRKHGVGKKEPGGLAPCSICGAVIDPTPWQVPVQGESSWFPPVSEKGSTVLSPFLPVTGAGGGGGGKSHARLRKVGMPGWARRSVVGSLHISCSRSS
jgi:hypothetical protein